MTGEHAASRARLEAARTALATALAVVPAAARLRAVLSLLTESGAALPGLSPSVFARPDAPPSVAELAGLVRRAAATPPSPERRAFAVLLVRASEALSALRGADERALHSFLEGALLNPLRRGDYPFHGSTRDRREALVRLCHTIDDHLRPLAPSIPHWIHGLGRADDD